MGAAGVGLPILRGAQQTAIVDALLGTYRPFPEHVCAAIEIEVSRAGLDAALVDQAAERATHLDPVPDAAAALDLLRANGHTLATLTNSGAEGGRRTLEAAGLADRFDCFLGVDEELNAAPDDVVLVAAHGSDVTGAKHAGLRTAWISRGEDELSAMAPQPDVRADDLLGAALKLT